MLLDQIVFKPTQITDTHKTAKNLLVIISHQNVLKLCFKTKYSHIKTAYKIVQNISALPLKIHEGVKIKILNMPSKLKIPYD